MLTGEKGDSSSQSILRFPATPGQPDFTRNGLLEKRMTVGLVAFRSQLVL